VSEDSEKFIFLRSKVHNKKQFYVHFKLRQKLWWRVLCIDSDCYTGYPRSCVSWSDSHFSI